MDDEEIDASKTGLAKGVRQRLFREIEDHTRSFFAQNMEAGQVIPYPALAGAVHSLERVAGLSGDWSMGGFVSSQLAELRERIGSDVVICGPASV